MEDFILEEEGWKHLHTRAYYEQISAKMFQIWDEFKLFQFLKGSSVPVLHEHIAPTSSFSFWGSKPNFCSFGPENLGWGELQPCFTNAAMKLDNKQSQKRDAR